ncbi:myosin heavy chain, clone 203-like [Ptychodera flava]|uniref:myosin heavy chain, clone 203-like n=1 Tax=Ptychodera flava TaxID=63121 RepID=UPI00396A34AD
MAYNERHAMANFEEYEENGQYGKYGDPQYYGGSMDDEIVDVGEQEYTGNIRTPTTSQGSKIPRRRSSGIPRATGRYDSRKTTPVTQEKAAVQSNERRIKTQTQGYQRGSPGGSGGREPTRVRSPEVRDTAVASPETASDGSGEVHLSSGATPDQVISQAVLEKLVALEDRLESVASDTGLAGLDTTERLSAIQERMNQLEYQNNKILGEVAKETNLNESGNSAHDTERGATDRAEIMDRLVLLEEKVEELVNRNGMASQNIETITNKILEEVTGKTSILQDSLAKIERNLTNSMKTELESMTKILQESGDKTRELTIENASLKAQVAQMGDMSKTTVENEQKLRNLEQENARLKMENSAKQQNIAKTSADKDGRIRKLESEKSDLQREVSKLQISSKSLAEKDEKIRKLEGEVASQKGGSAQVVKLTTTITQRDDKISELQKEITALKSKVSNAETKIAAQEEELQKAVAQAANQPENEEPTGKKSKKGGKFKLF